MNSEFTHSPGFDSFRWAWSQCVCNCFVFAVKVNVYTFLLFGVHLNFKAQKTKYDDCFCVHETNMQCSHKRVPDTLHNQTDRLSDYIRLVSGWGSGHGRIEAPNLSGPIALCDKRQRNPCTIIAKCKFATTETKLKWIAHSCRPTCKWSSNSTTTTTNFGCSRFSIQNVCPIVRNYASCVHTAHPNKSIVDRHVRYWYIYNSRKLYRHFIWRIKPLD